MRNVRPTACDVHFEFHSDRAVFVTAGFAEIQTPPNASFMLAFSLR